MAITTKQDFVSRLMADEMASALLKVQSIQDNNTDINKVAMVAVDAGYVEMNITEVDGISIGEESAFENIKALLIQTVKSSL